MADFMVSYAREDDAFVLALAAALDAHDRTSWVDRSDLLPAAPVRQEIFDAIADAAAVVLVLSPHWLASDYCRQEFAHALQLRKRVLPVLLAPVDHLRIPDDLADINWIRFDQKPFEAALADLLRAFSIDLDRIRLHARLFRRADAWLPAREASMLLRGAELAQAEAWLANAAAGEGEPTPVHIQFVTASRASETARQRTRLLAVSVALGVTLTLGITAALLYRTSEARRRTGQSRLLASEALARSTQRLDDALLLASHAQAIAPTVEARSVLQRLVMSHERLERMLHGATGPVEAVAIDPKGRFVAAGGSGGQVLLWHVETGRLLATEPSAENDDIIQAVAFNPVTGELAAGSHSGVVRIYDVSSGILSLRREVKAAAPVWSIAYSPDGAWLAVGDLLGTVQLVSTTTPEALSMTAPAEAPVLALAFDPDSRRLAIGRGTQRVSVHELTNPADGLEFEAGGRIAGLALVAAGDVLMVAGDQHVRRWHLADPTAAPDDRPVPARIMSIAAVDDGRRLAVGLENGDVQVLSADGASMAVLRGHGDEVRALAVGSGHIVAGSRSGRVIAWSLETPPRLTIAATLHRGGVGPLAFGPTGRWLASGDSGGGLVLWDRDKGTASLATFTHDMDGISALAFRSDSRHLAVASEESGLVIWDMETQAVARPLDPALTGIAAMAYGAGPSALVAVMRDSGIARLDLETGQTQRTAPDPSRGMPMCSALDASRRRLAFGTNEGVVAVIDLGSGRDAYAPLRIPSSEVMGVAFRPDNTIVGALSDGRLFTWDPTGPQAPRLTSTGRSRLNALALAPGSGIAAVGSEDGTILLWDVRAWQQMGEPMTPHIQGVRELAFDRDGTTLASTSEDGQVVLSRIDPETWAGLACQQANRPLGQERADFDLADVEECHSDLEPWLWRRPVLPPELESITPRSLRPMNGRILAN